jgi:hypothetical protein
MMVEIREYRELDGSNRSANGAADWTLGHGSG